MSESVAHTTPPDELLELLRDVCVDFDFIFSCTMAITTKEEETKLMDFLKNNKNLTPDDVTEFVLINIMGKRAKEN